MDFPLAPPLPTRSRRFTLPRPSGGLWPLAVVAIVMLPLVVLALHIVQFDLARWEQMTATFLPRTLINTLTLMLGVGTGTLVLGTALAWLVAACDFPGRRMFDRLLLLPLAVPGFIMGFVYVDVFEFAGPVQSTLRAWFGWERGDYTFPNIASPAGLIVVLTLVLYPYVYLLARAAFIEQSASAFEAAHMMGNGRVRAFVRVGLPMALPQIMAGVILVVFETMTDYGTVSYFSFPTLSERIIVLWNTEFDPTTAVQLALLMMVVACVLVVLEWRVRGRARYYQPARGGRRLARVRLRGLARWGACALCAFVLWAAFLLPAGQLFVWAVAELRSPTVNVMGEAFAGYAGNSFVLASAAAAIVAVLALLLTYGVRAAAAARRAKRRGLARLLSLGYAMPGAVIAAGVLVVVNPIDAAVTDFAAAVFGWPAATYLLTGTVFALLYGYTVRFLSIGFRSTQTSFDRISPSLEGAARTLGAGGWRIITRIHAPLVSTGVAAGALLVFVDVMKELPATLLLRPFGMDTLALRTYFLSIEGWHRTAAVPALAIVLLGLIPVFLLMRVGENQGERPVRDSAGAGDENV